MPKNKGKGGKHKKRGKASGSETKRELCFKEDGQDYAQILKTLGNGRFEAHCFSDGQKRLAHVRGKLHKKVWIQNGDLILLGLRDYQDDKADIILKYSAEEGRQLKAYGEVPNSININEGEEANEEDEGPYAFEDVDLDQL